MSQLRLNHVLIVPHGPKFQISIKPKEENMPIFLPPKYQVRIAKAIITTQGEKTP